MIGILLLIEDPVRRIYLIIGKKKFAENKITSINFLFTKDEIIIYTLFSLPFPFFYPI